MGCHFLLQEVSDRVGMTPSKEAGQPLPDVATNLDCKNEMPRVTLLFHIIPAFA